MFGMTKEEQRALLFLIAVALTGLGINFLFKQCAASKPVAALSSEIGKINLNSAEKDALMIVPGIGEKLAGRIIAYRQEQGEFSDLEELKNIKGITQKGYEKIKDYLFVK